MIVAAILGWSAATALCGLASTPAQLFATRGLLGLCQAALVPAAVALLAASLPAQRLGRGTALFTGGASLGRTAGLAAGGVLLGWIGNWQLLFVAMAVPGVLLALAMLTIREPDRAPVPTPRAGNDWRRYVAHFGASACVVLMVQTSAGWMPTAYVRGFGLSPAAAGVAVGSVLVIAAPLGHLAGGALTDWFAARGASFAPARVILISLGGSALLLPLALIAGELRLSLLLFGFASFFMTLGSPAALAGIQRLAPAERRGRVAGIFLSTTSLLGMGLGPPLVGWVADRTGSLPLALATTLPLVALTGMALAWRVKFTTSHLSHA